MSEKKEKKQDVTASQGDVDSLAGFAALVSAIVHELNAIWLVQARAQTRHEKERGGAKDRRHGEHDNGSENRIQLSGRAIRRRPLFCRKCNG